MDTADSIWILLKTPIAVAYNFYSLKLFRYTTMYVRGVSKYSVHNSSNETGGRKDVLNS